MGLSDLPKDLVEEILCRVPATSLKRLLYTCKRWNRLFDDKRFARKHSDKAPKQFLHMLLQRDSMFSPMCFNNNHLSGIVPTFKVVHSQSDINVAISRVLHCHGLFLCAYDNDSKLVVWNPLTGFTRWINNYKFATNYVFGYSQDKDKNKRFKILSITYSRRLEIYEFNSDSWRMLGYDHVSPVWFAYKCRKTVSLKGRAYWFAVYQPNTHPMSLIEFDFSTDKCVRVPLPYQCHSYLFINLSVVSGEEKICVLLQQEVATEAEVWVTNKVDEGTVSWTKVLALALHLSPQLQFSDNGSFLFDEEKKVFVWCNLSLVREDRIWMIVEVEDDKSQDMIYIVGEDKNVKPVDISVDVKFDGRWPAILNYVPSLVQL